MDATAAQVVTHRAQQFLAALSAGKLEWTSTELASYFLEEKKKAEGVTVPEHSLGPIDRARAALVAKTVASLLGAGFESTAGGYSFTVPAGAKAQLPTIVEKIVRVEVPAEKTVSQKRAGLEVEVKFPELPLGGRVNPKYVTPSWYKRLTAALEAGKHVAIAGPPGGGKSTAPEQYFIRRGQPFVVVNGDAGFRRRDMEGSVEIQGGTTFFRVAEFAAAAVNGWGCILNEVNAADPDALLYINGLLEVPYVVNIHGRAYPVHKDFRLIVTLNDGLIGTKALPQAFRDRFFPIKLGFPPKSFLRKMVVAKTGVDESAPYLERLLKYAQDCWTLHEKGTLRYQISPRRLFDTVWLIESGICTDVNDAIKQAVVDGVASPADCQTLVKLITSPLAEVGPVSQYA